MRYEATRRVTTRTSPRFDLGPTNAAELEVEVEVAAAIAGWTHDLAAITRVVRVSGCDVGGGGAGEVEGGSRKVQRDAQVVV
jgi:hypothetical protein